jgi:hypothetical protein
MATYLENLKTARDNAASQLAAASMRTDSPENIDKLLKVIKALDEQILEAATRDPDTGELVAFEIESLDR